MPNEIETFTETYVSNKIPCINEIDEICSILSCSSEYGGFNQSVRLQTIFKN